MSFWLILIIYLLLVLGAGVGYRLFQKTPPGLYDFWVATKRPLGLFALLMTFSATLFSAFFMVGLPGFVHAHGIGTWAFVIVGDVLGMFLLFSVGRRFVKLNFEYKKETGNWATAPLQILSPAISYRALMVIALAAFALPYLGIQIKGAGALIAKVSDGQFSTISGAALVFGMVFAYSLFTGIRGVVYSDAIQGLLLFCTSVGIATWFTLEAGGLQTLVATAYEQSPGSFGVPGPKGFFSTGVLLSTIVAFAAMPVTQPQFLSRYLLIRDLRFLRHVAIGFGVLLCVGGIAATLVGLAGIVNVPELASGDDVLAALLRAKFPVWLSQLVSIAVLAAAMSTADSILFSLSQMVAEDLAAPMFGDTLGETGRLWVGRFFVMVVAAVAFVVGIAGSDLIVQLSRLTFSGTLVLAPSIMGCLWRRDAPRSAPVISAVVGLGVFVILKMIGWTPLSLDPSIPSVVAAAASFHLAARA